MDFEGRLVRPTQPHCSQARFAVYQDHPGQFHCCLFLLEHRPSQCHGQDRCRWHLREDRGHCQMASLDQPHGPESGWSSKRSSLSSVRVSSNSVPKAMGDKWVVHALLEGNGVSKHGGHKRIICCCRECIFTFDKSINAQNSVAGLAESRLFGDKIAQRNITFRCFYVRHGAPKSDRARARLL